MKEFTPFIKDLTKLISYKSVQGERKDSAPFGEEVKNALNFFLSLAKDFGFETINYDNYAGEVIFGDGEEIGIIGHLDVVPAGDGWNTDPYTLTEKNGYFFGRGILDDKMPLLLCLYALKALKEEGITPNKKIRLILGTNEETGWQDVEYLKTKTTLPEYGFSPDGNFPLSYAEKGIAIVEFKIPLLKNFKDIKGGTVINAVCGKAQVTAKNEGINEKLLLKHGLFLKDNSIIESIGKSAHGSSPHLGKNAIKTLFNYFLDIGENVNNVVDYLFNDKGNLSSLKSEQGITTLSPNLIEEREDGIYIKCDCRFPYPIEKEDLIKIFNTFNLPYTISIKHDTQYVEKEGEFISSLISAYNEATGENAKPVSLGGSTFARVFNKGVAFGPEFEGMKGAPHEANECASKEEILKAYNIYKKAIYNIIK